MPGSHARRRDGRKRTVMLAVASAVVAVGTATGMLSALGEERGGAAGGPAVGQDRPVVTYARTPAPPAPAPSASATPSVRPAPSPRLTTASLEGVRDRGLDPADDRRDDGLDALPHPGDDRA
ncbi:hypothetical protein ABZ372_22135, partial [Streptomyces sp. NPDC005921]